MEFGPKEVLSIFVVLYFIYFLVHFMVCWKKESEREKDKKIKYYLGKNRAKRKKVTMCKM